MPHTRSLTVIEKISSNSNGDDEVTSTSYYLSNKSVHEKSPEYFAQIARGHWAGCEIKNHWIRDALWDEDATRSKNWKLNANLAIMRTTLIGLKAMVSPDEPWMELFERCQRYPGVAFQLITKHKLSKKGMLI